MAEEEEEEEEVLLTAQNQWQSLSVLRALTRCMCVLVASSACACGSLLLRPLFSFSHALIVKTKPPLPPSSSSSRSSSSSSSPPPPLLLHLRPQDTETWLACDRNDCRIPSGAAFS